MERVVYLYQMTLFKTTGPVADKENDKTLELLFESHNELFSQIDMFKIKNPFASEQELAVFVIGLRMFATIMVKYQSHPLFDEFTGAYRLLMMKLKSLYFKIYSMLKRMNKLLYVENVVLLQ